jgi:hypothetical protein
VEIHRESTEKGERIWRKRRGREQGTKRERRGRKDNKNRRKRSGLLGEEGAYKREKGKSMSKKVNET